MNRMNDLIKEKDEIIDSDFECTEKDKRLDSSKKRFELAARLYIENLKYSGIELSIDELLTIYNRSERFH